MIVIFAQIVKIAMIAPIARDVLDINAEIVKIVEIPSGDGNGGNLMLMIPKHGKY